MDQPRTSFATYFLIVACGFASFFRTPSSASGLPISPDSVSYAVVAQRIATLGRFDIEINHVDYPSIYPPTFSLLLSPIYKFFPDHPGAGIVVIPVFGVILALAAFRLVLALSNPLGGLLAVLATCAVGLLSPFPNYLMTDIPAAALILAALAILVARWDGKGVWHYAIVGVMLSIAIGLRSTNVLALFAILVAAVAREKRIGFWVILLFTPIVALIAATAWYQFVTFHDWSRSGYQFWFPYSYDFLSHTFSPKFFFNRPMDGKLEKLPPLIIAAVCGAWLVQHVATRDPIRRRVAGLLVLASLPIALLFSVYFFHNNRFYFVPIFSVAFIVAAWVANVLKSHESLLILGRFSLTVMILLAMVIRRDTEPVQRQVLEASKSLPDDARIVTAIDPVYFEPWVLRGTHRTIIPVSRATEYANTRFAQNRATELLPRTIDPPTEYSEACRVLETTPAIAVTADEELARDPSRIISDATYVDLLTLPEGHVLLDKTRFVLTPVSTVFARISPVTEARQ